MHRLRLRPGRLPDCQDLVSLEASCFVDPWSAESLATELDQPQSLVLVAVDGGGDGPDATPGLCGYVAFRVCVPEAELLRLAVAPAVRRGGVGRTLLVTALGELQARGVEVFHLEVHAQNLPARHLYESCGFLRVGCRHGYFEGGHDAWVYSRVLPRAG